MPGPREDAEIAAAVDVILAAASHTPGLSPYAVAIALSMIIESWSHDRWCPADFSATKADLDEAYAGVAARLELAARRFRGEIVH